METKLIQILGEIDGNHSYVAIVTRRKKQHFAPKLITFPSVFHTRTPLLFYFPISQGGETHTDARRNRGE